MSNRMIINDYIQGDPLSEENLDKTLQFLGNLKDFQKVDPANPLKSRVSEVENADKIRLSSRRKNIWLYTGYTLNLENGYIPVDDFWNEEDEQYSYFTTTPSENLSTDLKRRKIIHKCDVVVDGRYIDEQRDITLKWRGSKNQRVIDIKQSLRQNKIVLHCD